MLSNKFVVIIAIIISFIVGVGVSYELKSDKERQSFILEKQEELKLKFIAEGRYKCCLKNPCSYCLEHKEKIVCDCINEIMEGKAPCGECIGEILEGNANHYLSKEQLINALSKELKDREAVKRIIEKKYN